MWELNHKEGWVPKNWCFWIVREKTLESPLDCKDVKIVNSKGNQPLMFIGRAESETPIHCPPEAKSWLIRKDPDAGKDWGQEDEMVAWHHQLNGYESEQTQRRTGKPGVLHSIGSQRVRHNQATEQQNQALWKARALCLDYSFPIHTIREFN